MLNRRNFTASMVRAAGTAGAALATLPWLHACGGGGELDGVTVVKPQVNQNRYRRSNLAASSAAYGAAFTLPGMVDAWGIAIRPAGAGGHFWVLGGGTSWQFVGDVQASSDARLRVLSQDGLGEVYLPGADALGGDSIGKATGTVFNGAPITSNQFRVTTQSATVAGQAVEFDGSARFIFATDSGTLSAWTDRSKNGSTVRVNGPAQQVYDGAALGMSFFGIALKSDTWDTLWAADFGTTPQVRQFDKNWQLVPTRGFANPFASGALLDETNPAQGLRARPGEPVAFNIHVLGTRVFVLFCISQVLRDANGFISNASLTQPSEEDALDAAAESRAGGVPQRGRVVEYSLNGDLVQVYDDAGRLNAPWGVALAPADFGPLSGALLVGNFGGAGKIAAFNSASGRFMDFMRDEAGAPIGLNGLWGLMFGNGVSLGDSNALYFAAGPEGEAAGLFGSLRYVA